MQVFLILPLLCYLHLWLVFAFGVNIIPDWLFYDPESVVGSNGLISSDYIPLMLFLGTPVSFILGVVYTAWNGLWRWFFAYMLLGGVPVGIYGFAVMWAHITQ